MHLASRSFIAVTIFCGFIALGWGINICLSFAGESSAPGDILWQHGYAIGKIVMLLSGLLGLSLAAWAFLRRRPNFFFWGLVGLSGVMLAIVVYFLF